MKANKIWNIAALSLSMLALSACSKSASDTAAVVVPPECDRYFHTLSVCNANGEKASQQEADAMYTNLVQGWKDQAGSTAMSAEQCKTANDLFETAQKTGC